MTDGYTKFVNGGLGKKIAGTVGLPQPTVLRQPSVSPTTAPASRHLPPRPPVMRSVMFSRPPFLSPSCRPPVPGSTLGTPWNA